MSDVGEKKKKKLRVGITPGVTRLFIPVLLIRRWRCVVCAVTGKSPPSCPIETNADRISQLNGDRKSATPFFLTEEYANKLLPTCPCGVPPCADPSLARAAVGRWSRTGRGRNRIEPRRVAHNSATRKHANRGFLLSIRPPGHWFLGQISNRSLAGQGQSDGKRAVKAVRGGGLNLF